MLILSACGGDPAADPTTPVAPPIVVPPTTAAPAPTPPPPNLKTDTYCVPAPPPFFAFKVKIHDDRGYKKILDVKALVGPDAAFCKAQNQGGTVCPVRREDDPQQPTCTNLVSGISDTGRYGPNWFYNDHTPCRAAGEGGNDPGCRIHETNQYLVYAFGPGKFTACHENAVCTDFIVQ